MVPAYDGRQRKVQQELNERERDWGGGSRRGETHLLPSLIFKGVLESEQ